MKTFIKNRDGQKIAVVVDEVSNAKGLAFVMHGLGGFKEQPHIQAMREAFEESGYTTVTFDARDTLGESEGNYENATTTGYYQDLEDVIEWSKTQGWYKEPFVLAGHSLVGISTTLFTEHHPEHVLALAPISTVVSANLWMQTFKENELEEWKRTGWKIKESKSKPGMFKKLKWSFQEDMQSYDLLKLAERLTMPVLLAVGELDDGTPLKHQQILFDSIKGQKEIHVIKDCGHTPREAKHCAELKQIFLRWIKTI